jgi:hypothetical protein
MFVGHWLTERDAALATATAEVSRLTEAHGVALEVLTVEVSRLTEANVLARESAAAADAVMQEDAMRSAVLLTVRPDGYGSPRYPSDDTTAAPAAAATAAANASATAVATAPTLSLVP